LGNILALEVLERAVGGELGEELSGRTRGQENQSALLNGLKKEMESLGAFNAGAGVFGDDDVVGGRATMSRAVGEAGNGIGSDNELPFF
jgi:hypothetical protein